MKMGDTTEFDPRVNRVMFQYVFEDGSSLTVTRSGCATTQEMLIVLEKLIAQKRVEITRTVTEG